jgi:hypothetical protein
MKTEAAFDLNLGPSPTTTVFSKYLVDGWGANSRSEPIGYIHRAFEKNR